MKSIILGILLSLSISSFANDFTFNKVFEPEAATINSITKYNGSLYASSIFKIFKADEAGADWELVHEIDIEKDFQLESIESLFTIENESISILCYYNSNNEVYAWNDGFDLVDLPDQFDDFEIVQIKQTKSGRTYALGQTDNFQTVLFEIVLDAINVSLVPASNQSNIDGFSEDENGNLWVIGDEIEIFSETSFTTVDFNQFIFSDLEVLNNKIYYADDFSIYYWDYNKEEEIVLNLPSQIQYYFDEFSLGFEVISDTELVLYTGETDSGFAGLIKINAETNEVEEITNDFGAFYTAFFDFDTDNLLIGTEKGISYGNDDLNSFSESTNGLSGFISFLPYNSDNYFFGYGFEGGGYFYNKNDETKIDMNIDSDFGFRFLLGEANNHLIALGEDLSLSEDGGKTWQESNLLLSAEDGRFLFDLEYKNEDVYYLANNSIYSSLDFGKTWNEEASLDFGSQEAEIINFSIHNNEYLISTDDGIYNYSTSLELMGLEGEYVYDAKVVTYSGGNYIVAVYETNTGPMVYRKNLSTDQEQFIETNIELEDPFDDIGIFFVIQDNGNVILADQLEVKNYVLYMNEEETRDISLDGDFMLSFRENHKGEYIGSGLKGHIYQLETILSVNGEYELKIDRVYPNPARDFIKLQDIQNNTLVEITDNMGNNFEMRYNSGIDISKISNGMYFIKYENANGEITTSKFIKN